MELFYIGSVRVPDETERYLSKRKNVIKTVRIIGETKISYLIERFEGYADKPFKVIKKTMIAKISDYGTTHRRYYKTKQEAQNTLWMIKNTPAIVRKFEYSTDIELYKYVAEKLGMKDILKIEQEEV